MRPKFFILFYFIWKLILYKTLPSIFFYAFIVNIVLEIDFENLFSFFKMG